MAGPSSSSSSLPCVISHRSSGIHLIRLTIVSWCLHSTLSAGLWKNWDVLASAESAEDASVLSDLELSKPSWAHIISTISRIPSPRCMFGEASGCRGGWHCGWKEKKNVESRSSHDCVRSQLTCQYRNCDLHRLRPDFHWHLRSNFIRLDHC
jgi:hypothetical protein